MRRLLSVLALSLAVLAPGRAAACATCGAGDPTLTLAGTEQPFAGRVRVSISATAAGTSAPAESTTDARLTLGVAWAPIGDVMLSASAPLVWRSAETSSLERETGLGPGDLDLRARIVVLRDRPFAPSHLVTLQIGTRLPLAPALVDAQGVALTDGAQTASPTVAPLAGLAWSFYAAPFSLQTYALATFPTSGSDGRAHAVEARAAMLGLVQVVPALSLVAGAETRLRTAVSTHDGGGVVFATLGALLGVDVASPYLLVRIPLVSAFDDAHTELVSVELGAVIDA